MGQFKGYGMGFKVGDNRIQGLPRPRFVLTIKLGDIAEARGCSTRTVKRAIESGDLDVYDLKSLARYILRWDQ